VDSFVRFLLDNKAWWITPIVLVFALVAALAIFGDGGDTSDPEGATPFNYDVH
jgi:ABC-type dipeptide/oligopeptide/nickel transport system permease subunit